MDIKTRGNVLIGPRLPLARIEEVKEGSGRRCLARGDAFLQGRDRGADAGDEASLGVMVEDAVTRPPETLVVYWPIPYQG